MEQNKKAEISLNFIILAVIAIIVLVLILFLTTDVFSNTRSSIECSSRAGKCLDVGETCLTSNLITDKDNLNTLCPKSNQECCPIAMVSKT